MHGLAELGDMILDPTLEDQAIAGLQLIWEAEAKQRMARLQTFQPKPLRPARARQAVRELRAEGRRTTLPVPYICKDQPEIHVRKPWQEVFISNAAADLNQRRTYIVEWNDEVSLTAKGFDPEWTKEAIKHAGKHTAWGASDGVTSPSVHLADAMSATESVNWCAVDAKDGLIETVYSLYRALDEDGVPGVYMTVFNPHVGSEKRDGDSQSSSLQGMYGWHGLVDGARGKIPIFIGTRERTTANFCASRGVPEIVSSEQRELKVQHDAATDLLSMAVSPPRFEYTSNYGAKFSYGPGKVYRMVNPGKEPRHMDMPTKGFPITVEMMTMLRDSSRNYFGMTTAERPQGDASKRQKQVGGFLLLWSAAIQQLIDLARLNMDDLQFARITGAPEGWLTKNRSYGAGGVQLQFDVRELDQEYCLKQMEVMNKTVIPGDVTGAIDRNKWTRRQLRIVSPILARDLASDEGEASKRIYDEVRNELAQMFIGNEAQYTENDPAAKAKLQYAEQLVAANPHYQQALQNPESRFAQLLQKYAQNLAQSLKQEKNKQTGRYGVETEMQM